MSRTRARDHSLLTKDCWDYCRRELLYYKYIRITDIFPRPARVLARSLRECVCFRSAYFSFFFTSEKKELIIAYCSCILSKEYMV